jgi:hypothetical protein
MHFWCNQGGGAKEYCTHCEEMESALKMING